MKILLIQPKMNKRPMDTDLKTRMSPSLGLLTLMNLTPKDHEVTLINENIERLDEHCAADLVGISVTLDVLPRAREIAAAFQKRNIPVVAGGIHVTCCPEDCLPHFDAICIGPAERVWASLVQDAADGHLQQEYNDMADFRGEEIVSPLYSGLDQKKYLYTNVLTTSRGCPNRCSFCYNSSNNRLHVRRPVSDVLRDIKSLRTRQVFFIDDNFIGDPAYTRDLLGAMDGMNLVWGAAVTSDILDYPDLLDQMAKTGCRTLFIGFESINTKSLASVNKNNKVQRYEALVHAIHSRGIMINASMVFGLDGDDLDTFRRTVDWLIKMRISTLTSHILTPYPGTKLYQDMADAGRITDFDLEKYNTAHVVFRPAGMSAKELYDGYRRVYRQFYSFKSIFRRLPENKAQRKAYLLFNLLYRKYGRFTSAIAQILPMRFIGKLATRISYKV